MVPRIQTPGQRRKPRTRSPVSAVDAVSFDDPWELVWGQPYIDSERLAGAIERELLRNRAPDFRTRLLVRDASRALRSHWGQVRFARWLRRSPARTLVEGVLKEPLGKVGFHFIEERLVAGLRREDVEQILELLGRHVHERLEVNIGGSIPTLLQGLTARPTDDIDLVDEVPAAIRTQRAALKGIREKYGLRFGHVQSHYLPANWATRRRLLGDFGGIRAYLVDPYDVFISKLSSKQEKHRDDLRVMAAKLDRDIVQQRLLTDARAFLADPHDRPVIEENWRFIYREPLDLGKAARPKPRRRPS